MVAAGTAEHVFGAGCGPDDPGFDVQEGREIVLLSKTSRPAPGSHSGGTGVLSMGVKRPERKSASHSISAEN